MTQPDWHDVAGDSWLIKSFENVLLQVFAAKGCSIS